MFGLFGKKDQEKKLQLQKIQNLKDEKKRHLSFALELCKEKQLNICN